MFTPDMLAHKFKERYGRQPSLYRAPGRVNLIGEHTDYNDGFVMPAAIGFYTWVAASARDDRTLRIRSENISQDIEIDLDRIPAGRKGSWSDYVGGVAAVLDKTGHRLKGAEMLIFGDVPIGAGLSSSAAIEVAAGFALLDIAGFPVDRLQLSLAAQRAEHEYVGTRCGIMDQFISAHARSEHALLLDTRSLTFEMLPLPKAVNMVICNTMVKHELASGEYNQRRRECEEGVKLLAHKIPGITALRDVTARRLEEHRRDLPDTIYRRCRHVVSENDRVLAAAAALKSHDFSSFGKLMGESHASLRDDYQVSCRELDVMVELAGKVKGVFGARMTGGGFGGCTVNLLQAEAAEDFQKTISRDYAQIIGKKPEVYICTAADGAGSVKL